MSQLLLQLPASVCLYLDHVHVCLSVRLHACLSRPRSTPLYVSVSLLFILVVSFYIVVYMPWSVSYLMRLCLFLYLSRYVCLQQHLIHRSL